MVFSSPRPRSRAKAKSREAGGGFRKNHGQAGVVYVLENPGLAAGWFKIGCSRHSGAKRAQDLNSDANTGTPGLFKCIFEVATLDCGRAEQAAFEDLAWARKGKSGQEYFMVDLDVAKVAIRRACTVRTAVGSSTRSLACSSGYAVQPATRASRNHRMGRLFTRRGCDRRSGRPAGHDRPDHRLAQQQELLTCVPGVPGRQAPQDAGGAEKERSDPRSCGRRQDRQPGARRQSGVLRHGTLRPGVTSPSDQPEDRSNVRRSVSSLAHDSGRQSAGFAPGPAVRATFRLTVLRR